MSRAIDIFEDLTLSFEEKSNTNGTELTVIRTYRELTSLVCEAKEKIGQKFGCKPETGDDIQPLIESLSKEELRKLKLNLPFLRSYLGKKGEFRESNVAFVDIDTTFRVDEVLESYNEICAEMPNIVTMSKSLRGKLHAILKLPQKYSSEAEWRDEMQLQTFKFIDTIRNYFKEKDGTDLDYSKQYDDKGECAVDKSLFSVSQGLIVGAYDFYLNPNIASSTIDDAQRDMLIKEYGNRVCSKSKEKNKKERRVIVPKEGACNSVLQTSHRQLITDHFNGNFEIRKPHMLPVVDSGYEVCGEVGNLARMNIANVLWYYCKGDDALFMRWKKELFANADEFCHTNPFKGYYLDFKNWFDVVFGVVATYNSDENAKEACDIILGETEFISDRYDDVSHILFQKDGKAVKRALLKAPTGAGKTYFVKKYIAEKPNSIVLVPFNSMIPLYENGGSNVFVWDTAILKNKIKDLYGDFTVIVDESHTLFFDRSYRKMACEVVKELSKLDCKVLAVTATPIFEQKLLNLENFVEVRKEKTKIKTTVIHTENVWSETLELAQSNCFTSRVIVFSDRYAKDMYRETKVMEIYETTLLHSETLNTSHSETLEAKKSQKVISREKLPDGITFATSIAFNGINFKNDDNIVVIIPKDENVWTSTIIQTVGRFRTSKNISLYIVSGKSPWQHISILDKFDKKKAINTSNDEYVAASRIINSEEEEDDDIPREVFAEIEEYQKTQTIENIIKGLTAEGYFEVREYKKQNTKGGRDKKYDEYDSSTIALIKYFLESGVAYVNLADIKDRYRNHYVDQLVDKLDYLRNIGITFQESLSYIEKCKYGNTTRALNLIQDIIVFYRLFKEGEIRKLYDVDEEIFKGKVDNATKGKNKIEASEIKKSMWSIYRKAVALKGVSDFHKFLVEYSTEAKNKSCLAKISAGKSKSVCCGIRYIGDYKTLDEDYCPYEDYDGHYIRCFHFDSYEDCRLFLSEHYKRKISYTTFKKFKAGKARYNKEWEFIDNVDAEFISDSTAYKRTPSILPSIYSQPIDNDETNPCVTLF